MSNKRKSLSKKVRFEIFKRDSFTCQYCGQSAPEITLEIDHINPIYEGGSNDLINLITSCFECNRGKSKNKLTESDILKKQKLQIQELNEKKQQLQLFIEWKKELMNIENEQLNYILDILLNYNIELSEYGKSYFKRLVKKYGLKEVIDVIDISFSQYYEEGNKESTKKCLNFIERILINRKKELNDIFLKEKYYIRGILKNKFNNCINEKNYWKFINEYLNDNEDVEVIKQCAINSKNWTDFYFTINEFYGG